MIRVLSFNAFDAFNEVESDEWIRYVIVGAGLDLVVEAFVDPMLARVGP